VATVSRPRLLAAAAARVRIGGRGIPTWTTPTSPPSLAQTGSSAPRVEKAAELDNAAAVKLGVSTRAEAAATVHRMHVLDGQ
jgi:hypothetical protein